ncbi:hypothetical protein BJ508DRAFT_316086 [Ascobolus immersus RN42]|uniref:Uncharacterized protein n=1 Tax=Ascobolus immersus RN42 TaxID=1160509 RepID=A0A3N4HFJ4_ASCIM|nr:hypothetical protein BJ508DRAFT_316086 [Ascobolus immersus RN42]
MQVQVQPDHAGGQSPTPLYSSTPPPLPAILSTIEVPILIQKSVELNGFPNESFLLGSEMPTIQVHVENQIKIITAVCDFTAESFFHEERLSVDARKWKFRTGLARQYERVAEKATLTCGNLKGKDAFVRTFDSAEVWEPILACISQLLLDKPKKCSQIRVALSVKYRKLPREIILLWVTDPRLTGSARALVPDLITPIQQSSYEYFDTSDLMKIQPGDDTATWED